MPWDERRPIRAVVFDLDGTLYTSPRFAERIYEVAVARVASGRGLPPLQARRLMEEARQQLEEINDELPTLTLTCQELGVDPRELHRAFEEELHPEYYIDYDPVLVALLESLAHVCPMYVYTNNNLYLSRKILALLGVNNLFAGVFTIELSWLPKPSPEGVRMVLERVEEPPESILFVGDREEIDLRVPARMGCPTLQVQDVADLLQIHQRLGLIP
jgi:putative hydrolase of the HAD superfamily